MYGKLQDAPVAHIILLTGEAGGAISLAQLRRNGRFHADVAPGDDAILYLTSGATGEPKMVMVTHFSLVSNLRMGPAVLPLSHDDITVAFLPSAHIARRVGVELLLIPSPTPVACGARLLKLHADI